MAQEFLRDSCMHFLHPSEGLSDARAQLNGKLWRGNAEVALGVLRVD